MLYIYFFNFDVMKPIFVHLKKKKDIMALNIRFPMSFRICKKDWTSQWENGTFSFPRKEAPISSSVEKCDNRL